MRYANAIWNFAEEGVELAELIDEFAGFGYDAISFSSHQWMQWDHGMGRTVANRVNQRGLAVTAHCSFDITVDDAERLIGWFDDSLHAITFDAQMTFDSRGMLYDAAAMPPKLKQILGMSAGTGLRVAVEDFPLDNLALEFSIESGLRALMDEARYGILIDIGHLNMRLHKYAYFEGVSIAEYITRVPLPIVEVHVHDNKGERDQHGHIGFGNCDFVAVAAALKAVEFDGVSTIEIAPGFHDSTPGESKPHAKASLETWKALWDGARTSAT